MFKVSIIAIFAVLCGASVASAAISPLEVQTDIQVSKQASLDFGTIAITRRGADDGATHDAGDDRDRDRGKGGKGRGGADDGAGHASLHQPITLARRRVVVGVAEAAAARMTARSTVDILNSF